MRVLHFRHTAFSKLSETFLYDYVTELERQGLDCHVVTGEHVNANDRPFSKVTLYTSNGHFQPRRLWWRGMARLGLIDAEEVHRVVVGARLGTLIKQIRPHLVHAHFGNGGYIMASAAKKHGVPLVVSFYGYDVSQLPREKLWQRRYEELWQQAGAVVVLSEQMRDRVQRMGCEPGKIHVVHLARRMEEQPPVRRDRPVRKFVGVGRLVEKKGHEDAVRAFARLTLDHPDIRFEIVGDGPLQPRLERLINELNMSSKIRVLGALPNPEVLQLMEDADAFIACSRTAPDGDEEGTPTVLIEAQNLGLPCVATRHAGIPEMIPTENHGLLAPEGDVEAIAERMRALLSQPAGERWEWVQRGWRHARAHFDLATETRKLVKLYASLAGQAVSDVVEQHAAVAR